MRVEAQVRHAGERVGDTPEMRGEAQVRHAGERVDNTPESESTTRRRRESGTRDDTPEMRVRNPGEPLAGSLIEGLALGKTGSFEKLPTM